MSTKKDVGPAPDSGGSVGPVGPSPHSKKILLRLVAGVVAVGLLMLPVPHR